MRSWSAPPIRAPSSKPHGVSRWARYPRSHLKSWSGQRSLTVAAPIDPAATPIRAATVRERTDPPIRAPSSKPHGVSRWPRYPRSHLKSWRGQRSLTVAAPIDPAATPIRAATVRERTDLPTPNRNSVTVWGSLLAENKGVRLTNRNIVTVLGRSYLPPMRRITEPISSGVARLEPAGPLAGAGLAALDGRELAAFPERASTGSGGTSTR